MRFEVKWILLLTLLLLQILMKGMPYMITYDIVIFRFQGNYDNLLFMLNECDCRYDVAFTINTLGAKHLSKFVNECSNIKLLLHVSTGIHAKLSLTHAV